MGKIEKLWTRDLKDQSTMDLLFPVVYNQLRRLAQNQLKDERKRHTMNATALVHEAYLRLVGNQGLDWQNRAYFFALVAKSMRRILVDYARKHNAVKRGGEQLVVTFDEASVKRETRGQELILLDDALTDLQSEEPRVAKVVELKFFGGLTYEEIAEVLAVSVPTVRRDWRFARAWLGSTLRN